MFLRIIRFANEVLLPPRENGEKIQKLGEVLFFFGTVIYLLDKIIETQKITPTHRPSDSLLRGKMRTIEREREGVRERERERGRERERERW